jgi:isoleucyl-tRNA synthetase
VGTNLKDTLNLPKTDFPMRANLVEREPRRIEHWDKLDLYGKVQAKNAGKKTFILHDGPPFTNGDVHIGTALNKTLKDTILRYKGLRGYRTPYVPGWDCHGLPIEHKVAKSLNKEKRDASPTELREACANFSKEFIEIQRRQFRRLGVLADWDREYRTMDPEYEATILRTFAEFVETGLVYRSKKPVYWSIPCQTALAEAEVEYHDHKSTSVYVNFPFKNADKVGLVGDAGLIIWTTTPWTLPANLAIAVHPEIEYITLQHQDRTYIVAKLLSQTVIEECGLEGARLGQTFSGRDLEGLITQHPFMDHESPVVTAEYVTTESGTGCVHTAPGHGMDDYLTGLKHGFEIYCPVADNGRYIDDGKIPSSLVGLTVAEKGGKCEANEKVLEILHEKKALLKAESYHHSYPFCWRSKTPVVFRAMDQWFVSLDKDGLRQKAVQAVETVSFIPAFGQRRIQGSLETRPDWCISRQRSWGVPIPAFYDEEKEAYLDPGVIRQIADKVESHGTNLWFESEAADILEGIDLPERWKGKKLKCGTDTLDVWIDSGCSHRAVLQKQDDLYWPADLYLEGSDQHRGWFQSSLWTAMIADGHPPYKQVITHGFIVAGDGKKISKSDGKPQTADSYINRFGADILRLWICSEDFRGDIPLSEEIFKQITQAYRNLRNSLRFQLGNLHDFDAATMAIPYAGLDPLDKWALARTADLMEEVTQAYEAVEIHKVYQAVTRFCSVTLSANYHDILKDRLYTLAPCDPLRRSSQTAIREIFQALVTALAPILPFTTDEAWAYHQNNEDLSDEPLLLQDWMEFPETWQRDVDAAEIAEILEFKSNSVNDKLEAIRESKEIGQSLDAEVLIRANGGNDIFQLLKKYELSLAELFIVSSVVLEETEDNEPTVTASHAQGVRCPRSWRWVPELVHTGNWGEVSPRCRQTFDQIKDTATDPVE